MPLLVTLHVFSGVSDPQWVLSGDEEAELRELIASPAASAQPAAEGALGYRGFSVTDTEPAATPPPLFTHQVGKRSTQAHSLSGAPDIEDFLLRTGHPYVPDDVGAHVRAVIAHPAQARTAAAAKTTCPPCHAQDAPAYNPALWNHPPVQAQNNCYNYANNQQTNTFAQPGRATGHMYTTLDCASVGAGARSDGLVPCLNFSAQLGPNKGWYVALVIWPGRDYHWYRQDSGGCWSHKPGSTQVRNTDNAGAQIADPRTCDRGPYAVFCTYMITTRNVHIR